MVFYGTNSLHTFHLLPVSWYPKLSTLRLVTPGAAPLIYPLIHVMSGLTASPIYSPSVLDWMSSYVGICDSNYGLRRSSTNFRGSIKYLVILSCSVSGVLSSNYESDGLRLSIFAMTSTFLTSGWYWCYHQYYLIRTVGVIMPLSKYISKATTFSPHKDGLE